VTNVDDNIVTNHNGYGIRVFYGAAVNYSYNDLWQNTLGATDGNPVDGGGNISEDPLYNVDYTLQAGSPCIGAASDGEDMGVLFDECGCAPPIIEVTIDIKPGSDPNCFNSDGHGVIPVAILGSADFDVNEINPTTVTLDSLTVRAVGKSGKLLAHIENVNDDGFDDLVVQIEDVDGAFQPGEGLAMVTGNLYDGTPFEGSDSICIVP